MANLDSYSRSAKFLLTMIETSNKCESSNNIKLIRDCTKLFLAAYPFLLKNISAANQHYSLRLHTQFLTPIKDQLFLFRPTLDLPFVYLVDFHVTVILTTTPCPTEQHFALNKNPRIPSNNISNCKSLLLHTVKELPSQFQPDALLSHCNCVIDYLLQFVLSPNVNTATNTNKNILLSACCIGSVITGLCKICRFRPMFWPRIIPSLCESALLSNDKNSFALSTNSVKYIIRTSLVFLLRIPATFNYRQDLFNKANGLAIDSRFLSATSASLLITYMRSLDREDRRRNQNGDNNNLKRDRSQTTTESNGEEEESGRKIDINTSRRLADAVLLSLRSLPNGAATDVRQLHKAGLITILQKMVALIPPPRS